MSEHEKEIFKKVSKEQIELSYVQSVIPLNVEKSNEAQHVSSD